MTQKRLAALFGAVLVAFSVVMGRLYLLAQNQEYAQTAQAQTVTTLTLENSRGNLYDCNGTAITGYGQQYYALSIPGESSYAELFTRSCFSMCRTVSRLIFMKSGMHCRPF